MPGRLLRERWGDVSWGGACCLCALGMGEARRCVLISLHELGMATRDLRDQVLLWLTREDVAKQPGGRVGR